MSRINPGNHEPGCDILPPFKAKLACFVDKIPPGEDIFMKL